MKRTWSKAGDSMTRIEALGVAVALLDELARGGHDEASTVLEVLGRIQTQMIRNGVRQQSRRFRQRLVAQRNRKNNRAVLQTWLHDETKKG